MVFEFFKICHGCSDKRKCGVDQGSVLPTQKIAFMEVNLLQRQLPSQTIHRVHPKDVANYEVLVPSTEPDLTGVIIKSRVDSELELINHTMGFKLIQAVELGRTDVLVAWVTQAQTQVAITINFELWCCCLDGIHVEVGSAKRRVFTCEKTRVFVVV